MVNETVKGPKMLIRPMPADWWLKKPAYTWFMVRDITSVFIAAYCLFLMCIMERAENAASPAEFAAFYAKWGSWTSFFLHLVVLTFAVYHSVSFFNLTPQVLVVFRGEEKVPGAAIAGGHFALWAIVSLILIIIGLVA